MPASVSMAFNSAGSPLEEISRPFFFSSAFDIYNFLFCNGMANIDIKINIDIKLSQFGACVLAFVLRVPL